MSCHHLTTLTRGGGDLGSNTIDSLEKSPGHVLIIEIHRKLDVCQFSLSIKQRRGIVFVNTKFDVLLKSEDLSVEFGKVCI